MAEAVFLTELKRTGGMAEAVFLAELKRIGGMAEAVFLAELNGFFASRRVTRVEVCNGSTHRDETALNGAQSGSDDEMPGSLNSALPGRDVD